MKKLYLITGLVLLMSNNFLCYAQEINRVIDDSKKPNSISWNFKSFYEEMNNILNKRLVKDEFETTAEFERRRKQREAGEGNIITDLNIKYFGQRLFIVNNIKVDIGKYNADGKYYKIHYPFKVGDGIIDYGIRKAPELTLFTNETMTKQANLSKGYVDVNTSYTYRSGGAINYNYATIDIYLFMDVPKAREFKSEYFEQGLLLDIAMFMRYLKRGANEEVVINVNSISIKSLNGNVLHTF